MEQYLLFAKSSILTGRALAKALGIKSTRKHKNLNPENTQIVIRYGHRYGLFENDTDVNSKLVIDSCADSIKFFTFCREAGFYCPEYISPKFFQKDTFPVFIRNRRHFGGKDIIHANNEDQLRANVREDSFIVIPSVISYELRIHVINNEVVRIFKKVHDNPPNNKFPVRTAHNGWKYSLVLEPYGRRYSRAREIAVELAKSLGLSFGALDLGYDSDKKDYIVFEVNTAPGLVNNPNTFGVYLQYFRRLIDV